MMDDFQNVITGLMSVERRTELWQLVRSIAAEGHRAGIHLFMAIQDPSYTDLDLRVRRYMSPMCFRVSEALISRVVVNTDGAETLYPRQWMAILNDEVLFGFAFAPDDTDILRFLDNHPQPPLSFPAWLQELE
jgi:DNA segregation ATPase FtsK/SpoIIIE-like protein